MRGHLVEEVLRYESTTHCILQQATTEVELGGEVIPQGAVVLPLLASANRDESRFPNPDRFDIHLDTKGLLVFGMDIHFCLGAPLDRLEAKVMLEGMLSRLKDISAWSRKSPGAGSRLGAFVLHPLAPAPAAEGAGVTVGNEARYSTPRAFMSR